MTVLERRDLHWRGLHASNLIDFPLYSCCELLLSFEEGKGLYNHPPYISY